MLAHVTVISQRSERSRCNRDIIQDDRSSENKDPTVETMHNQQQKKEKQKSRNGP